MLSSFVLLTLWSERTLHSNSCSYLYIFGLNLWLYFGSVIVFENENKRENTIKHLYIYTEIEICPNNKLVVFFNAPNFKLVIAKMVLTCTVSTRVKIILCVWFEFFWLNFLKIEFFIFRIFFFLVNIFKILNIFFSFLVAPYLDVSKK